jgi:serine/threonine protein kinase|mmetsp:Transcript_115116/g.179809  ORF Transcript_115116/g.179809 Transcript_115116/m.179809 type:complete len:437 (+) Transcript_115116:66-1376(+)
MGCSSSNASQGGISTGDLEVAKDFHDQYLLGVKLGRGAFAQVRVATKVDGGDLRLDNVKKPQSAVKILDLRDKNTPGEASRQLQKTAYNEASVWKAIGRSPYCICLFDIFYSSDFCYMVMEKCSSGLLQYLEAMPELSERTLGKVFLDMLMGTAHVHSVKVVHRDIKPDNFLVGGDDGTTVKLGDFGLSAMFPKPGSKLTGVYGTAPFMCPEMLDGRSYDEKSDVWSVAVVVYAMLFGNFPYMPKEQSSKGMKKAILDGAPPKFAPATKSTSENANLRTDNAVSFVQTLLNRDPETRPAAQATLSMPYMVGARDNSHAAGVTLPSLRPVLHMAKKVGAFEVRDPSRETGIDAILNQLQIQRHGTPLPDVGRDDKSSNARRSGHPTGKSSKSGAWENSSNRSTAASGSELNSSSTSSNWGPKGSGWSKGTTSKNSAM